MVKLHLEGLGKKDVPFSSSWAQPCPRALSNVKKSGDYPLKLLGSSYDRALNDPQSTNNPLVRASGLWNVPIQESLMRVRTKSNPMAYPDRKVNHRKSPLKWCKESLFCIFWRLLQPRFQSPGPHLPSWPPSLPPPAVGLWGPLCFPWSTHWDGFQMVSVGWIRCISHA